MKKRLLSITPSEKSPDVVTRTFASTGNSISVDYKRFESDAIDELVIKQRKYLDEYFAKNN